MQDASKIERRATDRPALGHHRQATQHHVGIHVKRHVHKFLQHVASRIAGNQQQPPGSPSTPKQGWPMRSGKPSNSAGLSRWHSRHTAGSSASEGRRRSLEHLEEQFQGSAASTATLEPMGLSPFLIRADISVHAFTALLSDLSNLVGFFQHHPTGT